MNKRILQLALMLMLGASVPLSASPEGAAGLVTAATDGNLEYAQSLVAGGQDVNAVDKRGWTPLMWAVYCYRLPISEYLLEKGADPNIRSTRAYKCFPKGTTALIVAGYMGIDDQAELLVKKKAKVELVDESGKCAADYARQFDFPAVLRAMGIQEPANDFLRLLLKDIESGKDVNAVDNYGWTPLMWSVFYDDLRSTGILLEKGADPNIQAAVSYKSYPKGVTALMIAAWSGLEGQTSALLGKQAKVDLTDVKGRKATYYARERHALPVLKALGVPATLDMEERLERIAAGTSVNAPGHGGWTALMWAVFYEDMHSARILLESGANPNLQSTDSHQNQSRYIIPKGATALIIAGHFGMADLAQLLLKHNAKADIRDATGNTVETYARNYEFFDVLDVLVDRTRLPKIYTKVVLEFTARNGLAERYSEAMEVIQKSTTTLLSANKGIERVEIVSADRAYDPSTLLVKVEITKFALPGDVARSFGGPAAGSWYVNATLRMVDGVTGTPARTQILTAANRVARSSIFLYGTEKNYAKDTGAVIAGYLLAVTGKVKAPVDARAPK